MIKKYLLVVALINLCLFPAVVYSADSESSSSKAAQDDAVKKPTTTLEQHVAVLESEIAELKKQEKKPTASQASASVIIAPYLNIDALAVVLLPTYNEDILLLKQNQRLQNQVLKSNADDKSIVDHPLLEISGKVEGQAYVRNGNNSGHTSSIDLSSAELAIAAHINQWVTSLVTIGYDRNTGYPVNVSSNRAFIDQAFITLGNFNQSPWYGTLGQKYLPFGQYNNFMISATLPQSVGRTRAPVLQAGYQHLGDAGLYGNLYVFKGYTKINSSNDNINRGGFSLGYEFKKNATSLDFGADAITNIADAQGMQGTNGTGFEGFGKGSDNEYLDKRIPGVDLHGKYRLRALTFLAEYTAATKRFNENNLSFNGHGAQPQAFDFQAGYNFSAWQKASSFAIGYDRSWQALALNIPQQRYIATFNISVWKNTLASLEVQHAISYSGSDTASGQGIFVYPQTTNNINQLTARFGIYF
jgi:uncharacterized small protein (DUF1192 family)